MSTNFSAVGLHCLFEVLVLNFHNIKEPSIKFVFSGL